MELTAEYDPKLKSHLELRGNIWKGNVSYLSKNIYNEFVELMIKNVKAHIITKLTISMYYNDYSCFFAGFNSL